MPHKQPKKLSFTELGDLLQDEWKKGKIGNDVRDFIIKNGALPIGYLRERLKWVIERDGDGIILAYENVDNLTD